MTYTFYCLAAAFLLTYLPKLPLAMAMAKEGESGYDNRQLLAPKRPGRSTLEGLRFPEHQGVWQ